MLEEFTKGRYRALELLADHIREPSRELRLNSIVCNVSDDDLRWVQERVYYFLLKLLEDANYDPAELENDLFLEQMGLEEIGLTD